MTVTSLATLNLMSDGLMPILQRISQLAASSVVAGLWQGAALAAVVSLCLRLVPRATPAVRFAMWTTVFAILALLPLFHAYVWRTAEMTSPLATTHTSMVHLDVRWSFAVALLWLIASIVRAVNLTLGAVRLRGIWRRAVPVVESSSIAAVPAGLRGAQLCTSVDVDRPSVIGFLSPRILIPAELFHSLNASELKQIVLHEIGHLRRADDWINLLQKAALVLVPLNPALFWIERQLCFERELACDDDVLRSTNAPKAYATCLASLAEHRLGRGIAALSLGAWEKQSELVRRVHRVLRREEAMGRTQSRAAMAAMMLVLLAGAAELLRMPQLVSFATQTGSPSTLQAAETPPVTSGLRSAQYQPVMFHADKRDGIRGQDGARESLLKQSLSGAPRDMSRTGQAERKRRRFSAGAAILRVGQRAALEPRPRFVILTSWSAGEGNRMFSSSYAAVPTPSGWLVIQL